MDVPTGLSRRRWLILASSVLSFFAVGATFFAVPPLVPELVRRYHLGQFEVGLLMGAISAPAILLSIPLGLGVDRWRPRASGLAGLLLMGTGALAFAVAPSYTVLLAARLLFGIGGLMMNLLLARLISEAFQGKELSLAMGIFNAVYPASMIAVFSLHPWLYEHLGWRNELVVLAVLVALAIPLHLAAVPAGNEHRADPAPASRGLPRPTRGLISLAVSWMLFFGAFASVFTFAPQWAGGGPGGLLVVTAVTWVSLLLNPAVGHLIDRTGRPAAWGMGGQLVLAGALAAMGLGWLPPLPAMLLVGLSAASVPTAAYSLPARLVPPAQVGFAFGFITAFSNLGTLAGPAAAGALLDAGAGWSLTWIALALLAALGAAALLPASSAQGS